MNQFFLPAGYRENPAITFDVAERRSYWSEDRIRAARAYQFAVYQRADVLIREKRLTRVADIGCGTAVKLERLAGRHPDVEFWGIDQPSAIRLCRERYAFGHWLGVDLNHHPETPGKKFDLVIAADVIEHLENPDLLLRYIQSMIAETGYVLLSTPDRDLLRGRACLHSPNRAHVREWNRAELARYLESRGFRSVEHRIASAYKSSLSMSYARRLASRMLCGKTMRYSQVVLLQLGSQRKERVVYRRRDHPG